MPRTKKRKFSHLGEGFLIFFFFFFGSPSFDYHHLVPGGGFNHFLFSPLPAEMIRFDEYSLNGLVQPPTSKDGVSKNFLFVWQTSSFPTQQWGILNKNNNYNWKQKTTWRYRDQALDVQKSTKHPFFRRIKGKWSLCNRQRSDERLRIPAKAPRWNGCFRLTLFNMRFRSDGGDFSSQSESAWWLIGGLGPGGLGL